MTVLPNAIRRGLTLFAILGAAAFLLAACGGGGGGGGPVTSPVMMKPVMKVEPGNRTPTTRESIPVQTLEVGESETIDLSDYFADPDGDSLTYEVEVRRGENNVRASVSGNNLRIEGVAPPGAAVRVTASDPDGLSAYRDIDVSVTPDDSNSCQHANDGECDEPDICRAGTDTNDCRRPANRAPTTRGSIPAQTLEVGESETIDLSGYFTDPDGDSLTYEVEVRRGEDNVRASVSGNNLRIEGVAPPGAAVRVTASDPGGLSASGDVDVSVTPDDSNSCQYANDGECDEPDICRAGTDTNDCRRPANRAPTTRGSIPTQTLEVGGSVTINLSRYFTDPDGDSLTYELDYRVGQPSSVRASVSGDSLRIQAVALPAAAIRVTASDPGGLSAYRDIAVIVNPADHPNTIDGAVTISPGSSVSGSIASADDVDFFRLRLTRPGTVTFWTDGEADTVVALLDNDGNDLSSGRRGAASVIASGPSSPLVAAAGGRVSVTTGVDEVIARVGGQPGGSIGDYILHNSVRANLGPIALGLSSVAVRAGGPVVTVDLKNAFRDPEGGALTFHASFGAGQVGPINLGLTVSGSILRIESPAAMEPGPVSIRITASDPFGLFAVQLLNVEIQPRAAEEPENGDRSGCVTITIREASEFQADACRYILGFPGNTYGASARNSCSVRLHLKYEWSRFSETGRPWRTGGLLGIAAGSNSTRLASTVCLSSRPRIRYCASDFDVVGSDSPCYGDNVPWRFAN